MSCCVMMPYTTLFHKCNTINTVQFNIESQSTSLHNINIEMSCKYVILHHITPHFKPVPAKSPHVYVTGIFDLLTLFM